MHVNCFDINLPRSLEESHLQEADMEFVTRPPVTAMAIEHSYDCTVGTETTRLYRLLCVVRVEGGIRVKDLLDAQDKLNRTTARYSDTAFDEKNSPRLMVMFAMVGSQMSQRHLRSWDHNFGYDYEETQSEIDGQNDELDLLDSGAESEYFKHCAEKRGLDPDDDDENWSLYFEHLRRHASVDLPETVEGAAWSENEGMFTAEALHEMSSDDVNESCSGSDTDLDSDNGGAMAVESAEDDMTQYEGRAVLETIIERTDNHDCDADEDDEDDYNGEGGYESMGAPG